MALETKCLTPGAQFHTEISATTVSVKVDLGITLDISEEEAELLTRLLHNQFELVLKKYYEKSPGSNLITPVVA